MSTTDMEFNALHLLKDVQRLKQGPPCNICRARGSLCLSEEDGTMDYTETTGQSLNLIHMVIHMHYSLRGQIILTV